MIDTKNSYSYKVQNSLQADVVIGADEIINVAYDRDKQCVKDNKGCQRLGVASTYNGTKTFTDVYKKNNPDNYNKIVCSAASVGCSEWSNGSGGKIYFKDPGEMACEWRLPSAAGSSYKWLKKKVKTCGGSPTGALCMTDSNCSPSTSGTCKLIGDEACITSYNKTVGSGGLGTGVLQPASWAGICSADQSGCTEYIDPTSKFNENLIVNPDYKTISNEAGAYWDNGIDTEATQSITILPQTIYILKGAGRIGEGKAQVRINCPLSEGKLRVLDAGNNFVEVSDAVHATRFVDGGNGGAGSESLAFYFQGGTEAAPNQDPVSCLIIRSNRTIGDEVYLRQAVVDYQFEQNLDRTSPNGIVNNGQGFVLFNERAQNGSSKNSLTFNADSTFDTSLDGAPPDASSTPKNANVILKVKPDRNCAKWLSCSAYVPDPNDPTKKICLSMDECNKLGLEGDCANWVETNTAKNQGNIATNKIGNLSGYSKVGYIDNTTTPSTFTSLALADYYKLALMPQIGQKVEISNGGFEGKGGWEATAKILNQPSQIDALNLKPYQPIKNSDLGGSGFLVPEGRGILQLQSSDSVLNDVAIDVEMGDRYVLTFYSYSTGDGLTVILKDQSRVAPKDITLLTIGPNDAKNLWVKHALGFAATSTSYKLSVKKNLSGDAYLDDMRLAPALNVRCDDPTKESKDCSELSNLDGPIIPNGHCSRTLSMNCRVSAECPITENCITPPTPARPQYLGSSCRLYARGNSLACAYRDSESIYHKGIYGYCLEADPKNPATCLLWYPVSRIAGDQNEEGEIIDFGLNPVYYCIEAKDQCSAGSTIPEVYCNQFIEVNKTYFWNKRMSASSSFKMPDTVIARGTCSRTGLNCDIDEDCPELPQVCNWISGGSHGWCSISGSWCDNTGCPNMMQNCVDAGEVFPEDPLFYKPYSSLPTSTRVVDLGAGRIIPIESINRNTGGNGFFGARTGDTQPAITTTTTKQFIGYGSGNINTFLPYYGMSSQTKCLAGPNTQFTCNDDPGDTWWFGHENGDGNTVTFNLGNYDFCAAVQAIDLDYQDGTCGSNCKWGNIQSTKCSNWFEDQTCNLNDKVCSTGYSALCETKKDPDPSNNWKITVKDNRDDGDDQACRVVCYNYSSKYQITKGTGATPTTYSKEALKRIFINKPNKPSPWKLWSIVGNNYVLGTPPAVPEPSKCNGTGLAPRPRITTASINAGTDYCYIYPKITKFEINGVGERSRDDVVINGSGLAHVSFYTTTDIEQLPIKELIIDWGYKIDEFRYKLKR